MIGVVALAAVGVLVVVLVVGFLQPIVPKPFAAKGWNRKTPQFKKIPNLASSYHWGSGRSSSVFQDEGSSCSSLAWAEEKRKSKQDITKKKN